MKYYRNLTDYESGEVHRVSIGDYKTVTEAANDLGVARSNLVSLLDHLRVVRQEYDEIAKRNRWRLRPEAAEQGLGYRIISRDGCPFDVLSPLALQLVAEDLPGFLAALSQDRSIIQASQNLEAADQGRQTELDSEGKVLWLLDHSPHLTLEQVAKVVGISSRLVTRYKAKRQKQRDALREYLPPMWSGLPSNDAHRMAL